MSFLLYQIHQAKFESEFSDFLVGINRELIKDEEFSTDDEIIRKSRPMMDIGIDYGNFSIRSLKITQNI